MSTWEDKSMSLPLFPTKPIELGHFIGGQWFFPSTPTHSIYSPYNQQLLGFYSECSPQEIDHGIQEAQKAFLKWKKIPLKERCQLLFYWRQILLRDAKSISHVIASESGKLPQEAYAGLMKGIEVLEFAISLENLDSGSFMEVSRGVTCAYQREPLGVVAGITPFNFPAMVPMWMIPLTLATGNAFVWKPSEQTPLTSKWLIESLVEAGFPPGICTVLQGGPSVAETIISHPLIKAIGFIGSTPAAHSVYERGTRQGKRVLALGSAKNHIILLPDAEPNETPDAIVDSFTGCAGQRCMAASVLLAVGDCESLIQSIIQKASQRILGQDLGAIINQKSLNRLKNVLDQAETQGGGSLVLDGRHHTPPLRCEEGFWLGPSIIDQAQSQFIGAQQELFGPILTIIRVPDLPTALTIENSSPYGNATSVFTQNGSRADQVVRNCHSLMIGVNIGVPVPREPFSFGGTGESRLGCGDITGLSGVSFWTQLRKITTKWQWHQTDQNWMS